MKLALYALIALALCCLQHSRLAMWPISPDLPLALLAWALVDGDDDGVMPRAWLTGALRDLVDPAGFSRASFISFDDCFYTLAYSALGLAFLLVRSFLFRSRRAGWAGSALVCSLLLAMTDAKIAGIPLSLAPMMVTAALTAAFAVLIGWTFGGLPESVRPLGKGGA